ncbi:MAG: hypothetical protein Q8M16_16805 [Pirellulaceae bacterium]|nr:hypothetical protein [Pirellulaceae bacterium]
MPYGFSKRLTIMALGLSFCLTLSVRGQNVEPLSLPLRDQQLDANALFQALAADLHWTAAAAATLQQEFAAKPISGSLAPVALDRAQIDNLAKLFPSVFSLESKGDRDELVIDRGALQNTLREQKLKLRQHLAAAAGIETTQFVKLPTTWPEPSEPPSRVVIVLHGIHSTPTAGQAVALQLHETTKLPMLQFLYPNDAPVMESAEKLNQQLDKILGEFPDTQISLVGYSLGCLVARGALEWPTGSSEPIRKNVDQLILVCPPNHGSALWEYAPLLEGAEIWQRMANHEAIGRPLQRVVRTITDGLNEASADLDPNSPWMLELNRQPRPAHVRYSILAGDRGPIRPVAGMLMQVGLKQLEENVEFGPLAKRLADVTRMPELRQGRGDGVVKLQATKLDGVDDWELLPISHLDWGQVKTDPGRMLVDAITKRLVRNADGN